MVLKAGLLSSHCENLCNGPSSLVPDGTVLTQRRRLRNTKLLGISRIPKLSLYEEILLLLILVNCCTAWIRRGNAEKLEAAGLLCGDSSGGRAECVRRQCAANFNGRAQQCDGDGDDNNVMESRSTDHLVLPPQ